MGNLATHLPYPITSKYISRDEAYDGRLRVGTAEMQGFRLNMEDAMEIRLPSQDAQSPHSKNLCFFGVFDGHGGEKASSFTAQTIYPSLFGTSDPRKPTNIVETVLKIDAEFCQRKQDRKQGTTAVFSLVEPLDSSDPKNAKNPGGFRVVVANLGDSRALLVRSSGRFLPLTKDHKPDNFLEKQRIEAAGGTVSFHRVDGDLAVSRAIGDYVFKNVPNKKPQEQKVIAVPEVSVAVARPGDSLLLCCDGLFERLTSKQVAGFVYREVQAHKDPEDVDPADIASRLLALSLRCGSGDNMSAILVYFKADGPIEGGGEASSLPSTSGAGGGLQSDDIEVVPKAAPTAPKVKWAELPRQDYEQGLIPGKASRQYMNAYRADASRTQTKMKEAQAARGDQGGQSSSQLKSETKQQGTPAG
eukprot:gb/GEZN01006643.1/.p1 GENE.gb/GEZN01006643.1/~~gb/GEZN01006643.1/.p1  ORF type:complete len:416 (-),score=66.16 gb/GEZN01006643.1/:320-1567(-)